jgi:hypothetical protein
MQWLQASMVGWYFGMGVALHMSRQQAWLQRTVLSYNSGAKAMKKRTKVTPGPYRIAERNGGSQVYGIHDVSVAWFGEAFAGGIDGSHSIGIEEAHANAELFVKALEENQS